MKPILYNNYYWQNELVRLRALTCEDWEDSYPNYFDSQARFFLQEEMELPPVVTTVQEEYKKFADFNKETGRIMFTIETLNGISVGGLNLHSINERNGTFGIGIQISIDHRRKGYGTAAMRILLKYAFLERRLNKFNVYCVERKHRINNYDEKAWMYSGRSEKANHIFRWTIFRWDTVRAY